MGEIDFDKARNQMAEGLLGVVATLQPLWEAVEGHKARLLAMGFSEENAQHGAMELHGMLLRKAFGG